MLVKDVRVCLYGYISISSPVNGKKKDKRGKRKNAAQQKLKNWARNTTLLQFSCGNRIHKTLNFNTNNYTCPPFKSSMLAQTDILHPLMHYSSTTTVNCRRLHYICDEKNAPKENWLFVQGFTHHSKTTSKSLRKEEVKQHSILTWTPRSWFRKNWAEGETKANYKWNTSVRISVTVLKWTIFDFHCRKNVRLAFGFWTSLTLRFNLVQHGHSMILVFFFVFFYGFYAFLSETLSRSVM